MKTDFVNKIDKAISRIDGQKAASDKNPANLPKDERQKKLRELSIRYLAWLPNEEFKNLVTEVSYNREKNGLNYCHFQF